MMRERQAPKRGSSKLYRIWNSPRSLHSPVSITQIPSPAGRILPGLFRGGCSTGSRIIVRALMGMIYQ